MRGSAASFQGLQALSSSVRQPRVRKSAAPRIKSISTGTATTPHPVALASSQEPTRSVKEVRSERSIGRLRIPNVYYIHTFASKI